MRHPSPSRGSPSSWIGHRDQAKQYYERGDYEAALTSFMTALSPEYECPAAERQILLSNLVACRLKVGGAAQARAAVENAKQCIDINPQWSKGHVRLASAYIALGGHSNDACNALQRALSLDPRNQTARDMLVRELRRDRAGSSSVPSDAPPQYDDEPDYTDRDYGDVHSPSFGERVQGYTSGLRRWYRSQTDDVKTFLGIVLILLCLYVAFGGRFGLMGLERNQRGNYGYGNAYDRYRYGSSSYHDDYSSNSRHNHRKHSRRASSSYYHHDDSNYHGWRDWYSISCIHDRSPLSLLVFLGLASFVSLNFLFSPLYIMWGLHLFGVLRRRAGWGVGGYGMGNGGGMFGRRWRGRNGWY